jgi:hypothetical protein
MSKVESTVRVIKKTSCPTCGHSNVPIFHTGLAKDF